MNVKTKSTIGALLIGSGVLLGSQFAGPVGAEMKSLLVRDTDTPALAPFRASLDFSVTALNTQRLVTTVPAGKRLVIQHVSYWTFAPNANQFVFGALRNGQFGPNALSLQVNPPHASAAPSLSIQDGSMPVTVYFEPGEEVWLSVSKSTGDDRQFNVHIYGYFITP